MDNLALFRRQNELALSIPDHVTIVGCGGVGAWAGLFLALAGVPTFDLYDEDRIELSNLNRLPYTAASIDQVKSSVLAEFILARRPDCSVRHHTHFHPLFTRLPEGVVICAVDTIQTRREVFAECRRAGATYWDVGAEADSLTLSDSPASWELAADQPGYFTPIFVAPVAAAASLLAWHILAGQRPPRLYRVETPTREDENP